MNISITTTELYFILDMTPASENIMLSGRHGIGKSQILTDYFTEKGCKVVSLFLGQMSDPGDLLGLPNRNDKTGGTVFMPPFWFPKDKQPVVLFLDELNRARPEVLQTIMDLALSRTIAGRTLPEGSRIIAAVNEGDEYQLTDLDPALVSRFNVYQFKPKADEWISWAKEKKLDERVLSFITQYPEFLDGLTSSLSKDSTLDKTPDRRGWEHVSLIIRNSKSLTPLHQKAIAGIVGVQAASLFCMFTQNKNCITARKLLLSFNDCKKELDSYKTADFALLNEDIYRHLELDVSSKSSATASVNLSSYISWLSDNHKRESLAHFCMLFENESYIKANAFIVKRCPEGYTLLTDFIDKL